MATKQQVEQERAVVADRDGERCMVCGGPYQASKIPGLVACSACDFISANVEISDAELAKLYGEDYFHGEEYLDYVAEEESLRRNFRGRLRTLKSLSPNWAGANVFEIGCAYGFFLREISGQVAGARGIDISEAGTTFAREQLGLDVTCGDYITHDIGTAPDVIAMWDTIEHLRRPDLFIQKASQDIKPGGLLAITTGDIGSLNAQFQGKNWRMIHPPTHMHYFSSATMSKLLDRYGFDVVHLSHPGVSRSVKAILYILLALKMKRPKLYDVLSRAKPMVDMHVDINLFDIMFVVARRRPR